jgi:hypothetical protein
MRQCWPRRRFRWPWAVVRNWLARSPISCCYRKTSIILRHGLQRARRTLQVIRQNLWWSFAYNFVALPLAIAGYVTPWLAGIGMSASSLLVVLNSLRIQRLEKD